ncbi:MAG: xanthine dehydrogenase family protein [Deltaproteobacteria bacterium]|nr:xanthine dehydrogenase family protein [Deltaproteobacteria bacterium]
MPDDRIPQIGVVFPRTDALTKVRGEERFAADYYGRDLVWAGVKRAGIPHARLKSLDVDQARQVPGVIAVLTHRDIPGENRQGVVRKDQPVLVDDKVRHAGDALALVLAESKSALAAALKCIMCELEPLPGVFDPEQALADGAPLVHEDNPEGNILLKAEVKTGGDESVWDECAAVIEACFETPHQEHCFLETESGWAKVEPDGKIVIVASTQAPFRDRTEVAPVLGQDPTSIRVIAPYTGGAFGGKDGITVQSLLGLAALHAQGRPVKMWWDREESFVAGTKRHPARMYYRLGAKTDGTLHAIDVRLYLDTGPYDHLGGAVMTQAVEHSGGPYRIPHARLRGWSVYTNNPIGGAFRGFGVVQVTAAMEQMMDLLAVKLGLDPVQLRLKNAVRCGDKNCVGVTLTGSAGLEECLEKMARHPYWQNRQIWIQAAGSLKRRGVGLAAVMHAMGYGTVVPDVANAQVELTLEGKIRVYSGVVDMGQGNAATNLQIAGSILGQAPGQMELVQPDTDRTLPSGSASASRCTYTFGNALIGAAQALKERILQRASDLLMAAGPDELVLVSGLVRRVTTGQDIPLAVLAKWLTDTERIAVYRFRAPVAQERPAKDEQVRLHGLPHCIFSYGAHLAMVEVDELTGAVEVQGYLAITDSGRVLNPQTYEQQIHGGIVQGLGYALSEDFRVADGRIQTSDLATYIIPTAMDVPEMLSIPVEINEPTGPFGLKGVGEVAMNGPLPAVANAVAAACGGRCFSFPLTSERVLQVMTFES